MAPRKTEKLDALLKILYVLLEDVLLLSEGAGEIRNADIRRDLEALACARFLPLDSRRRAAGR